MLGERVLVPAHKIARFEGTPPSSWIRKITVDGVTYFYARVESLGSPQNCCKIRLENSCRHGDYLMPVLLTREENCIQEQDFFRSRVPVLAH